MCSFSRGVVTFSFSEMSYFWSSEFWGALDGGMSRAAKTRMTAILLASGLIAAFAGPSDWNAGGTEFYLAARETDLFPGNLSISDLPTECSGPDATEYAICPSGGFKPLSLYTSSLQTIRNDENLIPVPKSTSGQWGSYGLFQQQIVSVPSIHTGMQPFPTSSISGSIRGIVCQTEAVAPFVPILLHSLHISNDWEAIAATAQFSADRPSLAEYRWRNSKIVSTPGKIPAVRTMCSAAQNLSTTATRVNFPILPPDACPDGELSMSVPNLNNNPSSSIRLTWVHDFPDEAGSVSSGIIFEAPWTNRHTSRVVVGCSIDARWTAGKVKNNQAYPSDIASPEKWKIVAGYIAPMFMPPNNKSWLPIHLDDAWVKVSDPQGKGQGHLQSLLASSAIIDQALTTAHDQTDTWNQAVMGSSNRTLLLEWITSLSVVDSLSRYGTYRFLNTSGPQMDWDLLNFNKQPDFTNKILSGGPALEKPTGVPLTTFRTTIILNGLLYRASSVTDCLALGILIAHILIALGHTMHLILYRKSSASWDTISEFLALAHNSRPSKKALRNASAGIRTKKPFSKIAHVRAVTMEKGTTAEAAADMLATDRAELIFVESDDEDVSDDQHDPIENESTQSVAGESAILLLPNPQVVATRTWPLWSNHQETPFKQDSGNAHARNISTSSTKPLLRSSEIERAKKEPHATIIPDYLYQ
ncbi:hypothetical protein KVR01_011647 [Diaporthe batatas]|uniref:uncharacterized protein n=1 Tax=Diaporthe batatas TaxID=748121 RepID=UPI001D05A1E1|nr:uncharacterized protein KVR01_011647 [Diaporthe batatas]KAG8158525.1 hypothetical protein KVR01_011647 [Diaporthe batatas]